MQCRCKKIIITRRVINNITDPVIQEICQMLIKGSKLFAVRMQMKIPLTVFYMFVNELKRLLLKAGIKVRGV